MRLTDEQLKEIERQKSSCVYGMGAATAWVQQLIDSHRIANATIATLTARVGELEGEAEQLKEAKAELAKLEKHYYAAYKSECRIRDTLTASNADLAAENYDFWEQVQHYGGLMLTANKRANKAEASNASLQSQLTQYTTLAATYGITPEQMLELAKSQIETAKDNVELRARVDGAREVIKALWEGTTDVICKKNTDIRIGTSVTRAVWDKLRSIAKGE
jgi:DNA repair exonuclease SbcCD ATPase subunit